MMPDKLDAGFKDAINKGRAKPVPFEAIGVFIFMHVY